MEEFFGVNDDEDNDNEIHDFGPAGERGKAPYSNAFEKFANFRKTH